MKTRLGLLSCILLFCSGSILSQDLSGISGAFVDIGFGARPVSMGSAYVALANDVNSVLWNPAGLTSIDKKQAAFSFTNQYGLLNYHYVAFTTPLKSEYNGIGGAIIYSADDALSEMTFQIGYALRFEKLSLGLSIKYRRASFGNNTISDADYLIFEPDEIEEGRLNQVNGSGNGVGFDVGLQYSFNDRITLGVMFRDIYSPVFWNSSVDNEAVKSKGSYSELIPFEPILGTAIKVSDDITMTTDYAPAVGSEMNDKFRTGIEARFFELLYLRGGYQNYVNNFPDDKFVLGFGVDVNVLTELNVLVDYAFMIEELANTHRFSIAFEF